MAYGQKKKEERSHFMCPKVKSRNKDFRIPSTIYIINYSMREREPVQIIIIIIIYCKLNDLYHGK